MQVYGSGLGCPLFSLEAKGCKKVAKLGEAKYQK
jgi:hypothetical protein